MPKYFAVIYQCTAKNNVRYYLNAVKIERHLDGGVIIAATTGHFMGTIYEPEGWRHQDNGSLLLGLRSKRMLSSSPHAVDRTL